MLWSCTTTEKEADFYIWKNNPDLQKEELALLEKANTQTLHVRFFDIAASEGFPEQRSVLKEFSTANLSTEFVPTVFITNEAFQTDGKDYLQNLAEKTFEQIESMAHHFEMDFDEIQIDCDWMNSTQENYFEFLENLQEISQKEISSTLRLHQIKYKEQTGIPPIDKVYLMAYATSSPIEEENLNSILDLDLLKNYLSTINDYPLDFDIALPIYSWAIAKNHLGKKKLINGISSADLDADDFKLLDDGTYEVQRDLFLNGIYLNEGFTLKIEHISPELLKETKDYLDNKIKKPYRFVYYHLDREFTNRYSTKDLL